MNNITKEEVKYLWLPEGMGDSTVHETIELIMSKSNNKVPFGYLEDKLTERFKFFPMIRVTDERLRHMFKVRRTDMLELYPIVNGVVHNKTEVYRPSVVN